MYAYQKRLYCLFIIFNFAILQTIVQIANAQNKLSPTKQWAKQSSESSDLTSSEEEWRDYFESKSTDAPTTTTKSSNLKSSDLTSSEEDWRDYFESKSTDDAKFNQQLAEKQYRAEIFTPLEEENNIADSEEENKEENNIAEIFKELTPLAIQKMTPEEKTQLLDAINAEAHRQLKVKGKLNGTKGTKRRVAGGVVEVNGTKGTKRRVAGGVVEADSSEEKLDAFERRKLQVMKRKRLGRHTEFNAKNGRHTKFTAKKVFPEEKIDATIEEADTTLLFPEEKMFPEEKIDAINADAHTNQPQLPVDATNQPQLLDATQLLDAINADAHTNQLFSAQLLDAINADAHTNQPQLLDAINADAHTNQLFPAHKQLNAVNAAHKQLNAAHKQLNAEQINAEQTNLEVAGGVVDSSEVNENSKRTGTWTIQFAGLAKNTGVLLDGVSFAIMCAIVATTAGSLAVFADRLRNARLRGKEKNEATKDEKKGLVETV